MKTSIQSIHMNCFV